jgi:hypothetical protein
MNLTAVLAFLVSLKNTLLQDVESVGATFVASEAQTALQFGTDERQILIDIKKKWTDTFHAEQAKGTDLVNSIENASTAAYQMFCSEEQDAFTKVKSGTIANLEYAAKKVGGIITGTPVGALVPATA